MSPSHVQGYSKLQVLTLVMRAWTGKSTLKIIVAEG